VAALLGVSWSPVVESLPDLGQLVDVVEAPGWELERALANGRTRVLLHNLDLNVSLADPTYTSDGWAGRAQATIARAGTPWFSLHLGFSSERVRFDDHMLPESALLPRDALLERTIASVRRARAALDLPLLLENLDYCPEGAYEHVCEPAFIAEVLDATDAGLLLDLGHLLVTASWLRRDPAALLAELPLERVVEVHISGPRPECGNGGRLNDVHDVVTEREVQILRDVLQRSTPRAVVLEYRRDATSLREQLAMLGRVIGRRWRGRPC
jgi:uncharacterized protein (UPF0276 family)